MSWFVYRMRGSYLLQLADMHGTVGGVVKHIEETHFLAADPGDLFIVIEASSGEVYRTLRVEQVRALTRVGAGR